MLAPDPLAVVLGDARTAALLALASYAVVLAFAPAAALLAGYSCAVVLADAGPVMLDQINRWVLGLMFIIS